MDTSDREVLAGNYGRFLVKHGASAVSATDDAPQKGDIAVFSITPQHQAGHVEIYNGSQWVSDYKQNNFLPWGANDHTPYTIYRFPGN
jgi:hypothetical protein